MRDERLPQNYAEFWPYYLRQHGKASTRAWHYLGTSLAIVCLCLALFEASWWWFLMAAIAGYAPAWIGHAFVEHNRPATFTYPFWSLVSDFRMFWLWLTGRLEPELTRSGVEGNHSG